MNKANLKISNKASIIFALFFVFQISYSQTNENKKIYSPFKIKSPLLISKINSDTIVFKQMFSVNYGIGVGYSMNPESNNNFKFEFCIASENYKFSSDPINYINSYSTKFSAINLNLKIIFSKKINKNTNLNVGISNHLIQPYKYSTKPKNPNPIYSSPNFSSSFYSKYDIRMNLQIEHRLKKQNNNSLIFGVETSLIKNNLNFSIERTNTTSFTNYKLKYTLIQPFICVNHYW